MEEMGDYSVYTIDFWWGLLGVVISLGGVGLFCFLLWMARIIGGRWYGVGFFVFVFFCFIVFFMFFVSFVDEL